MRGSRRAAVLATIAAVAAGLLAGGGTAAGQQTADARLGYTCRFPSGDQPVGVRVVAAFPAAGAVGQPIQPSGVSVTITLPPAAVADLVSLQASTVAASAALTVAVAQEGASATATWSGLDAPATPLPSGEPSAGNPSTGEPSTGEPAPGEPSTGESSAAEPVPGGPSTEEPAAGGLTLTGSGAVAPVTVGSPGDVRFTAAGLAIRLVPQRADGSGTEPAALAVACRLDPDQPAVLATVPVAAKGLLEGGRAPARPGSIDVRPRGADQGKAAALQDEIPPECGQIPPIEEGLPTGCTYVTGFSNVAKLHGAVLIEPGLMNVALANFRFDFPTGFQDNIGDLPAGAFPPSTATFLAFGFLPIKAKMELTQVGPMHVDVEALLVVPFDYSIRTSGQLSVRIFDVTVNGVPLDVGPNCRSAEPMDVVLTGSTPDYGNILSGGPLQGVVTIPPFAGCGVTEDLDPLLTGSVSGPGNAVKLTQGTLCSPPDASFCPPTVPVPLR